MNSDPGLYDDLVEQGVTGLSEEDFHEHERRLAIAEGLIDLYAVKLAEPTNLKVKDKEKSK